MADDIEQYRTRAANQPRPANWVEPRALSHTHDQATELSATSHNFFADWSEFQPVVTTAYPYPVASFRLDTGYRLDNNVRGNWSVLTAGLNAGRQRIVMGYFVFVAGQSAGIQARIRNLFGSQAPTDRFVIMNDMESGAGFAGPGNHSAEANDFAEWAAEWTGSRARTYGYANGGDWASCWPSPPAWMKRHIASYGTQDPSPYGWQYAGGNPANPSPAGFPRACAPFGSYIDMNVINKPIDQIEADFGVGDDVSVTDADATNIANKTIAGLRALYAPGQELYNRDKQATNDSLTANNIATGADTDAILAAVQDIKPGAVDVDALATAIVAKLGPINANSIVSALGAAITKGATS